MPTARELLEQADALMRRNRAPGARPPDDADALVSTGIDGDRSQVPDTLGATPHDGASSDAPPNDAASIADDADVPVLTEAIEVVDADDGDAEPEAEDAAIDADLARGRSDDRPGDRGANVDDDGVPVLTEAAPAFVAEAHPPAGLQQANIAEDPAALGVAPAAGTHAAGDALPLAPQAPCDGSASPDAAPDGPTGRSDDVAPTDTTTADAAPTPPDDDWPVLTDAIAIEDADLALRGAQAASEASSSELVDEAPVHGDHEPPSTGEPPSAESASTAEARSAEPTSAEPASTAETPSAESKSAAEPTSAEPASTAETPSAESESTTEPLSAESLAADEPAAAELPAAAESPPSTESPPSAESSAAAAGPSTAMPAPPLVDRDALAEEIRMQVLQRIDIFTDTRLREQLGERLKPVVDRASAELVHAISQQVGDLMRAYLAEAIEREIERWRNGDAR